MELVYIMLLGINTIHKTQNDSNLSTVAEIKVKNDKVSVLMTSLASTKLSTYSIFDQSTHRSIMKPKEQELKSVRSD